MVRVDISAWNGLAETPAVYSSASAILNWEPAERISVLHKRWQSTPAGAFADGLAMKTTAPARSFTRAPDNDIGGQLTY